MRRLNSASPLALMTVPALKKGTSALHSLMKESLYICAPSSGCDFCYDLDGDGYGMGPSCEAIDCDDESAEINRGMADDVCDGVDNDCNGLVDDEYPGICLLLIGESLMRTALGDRWAIYEMVFYSDSECTAPLQGQIEMPFSSVEDPDLEALLHDGVIDPTEGVTMAWRCFRGRHG